MDLGPCLVLLTDENISVAIKGRNFQSQIFLATIWDQSRFFFFCRSRQRLRHRRRRRRRRRRRPTHSSFIFHLIFKHFKLFLLLLLLGPPESRCTRTRARIVPYHDLWRDIYHGKDGSLPLIPLPPPLPSSPS